MYIVITYQFKGRNKVNWYGRASLDGTQYFGPFADYEEAKIWLSSGKTVPWDVNALIVKLHSLGD